jgi:hypothetical protein
MTRSSLLRVAFAVGLAAVVTWATLLLVTVQWGHAGDPEVQVADHVVDGTAYSYSVAFVRPGWAWPVALAAGCCAAIAVLRHKRN